MAFVISKSTTFNWPITILSPKDGGNFDHFKATVKYNNLKQSRIDEILKNEAYDDEDILPEVVAGWDNDQFADADGKPLLFENEDDRHAVFNVTIVRNAMIKGYFESQNGKRFKRKN